MARGLRRLERARCDEKVEQARVCAMPCWEYDDVAAGGLCRALDDATPPLGAIRVNTPTWSLRTARSPRPVCVPPPASTPRIASSGMA
jgi:hypothetical protein